MLRSIGLYFVFLVIMSVIAIALSSVLKWFGFDAPLGFCLVFVILVDIAIPVIRKDAL